MIKSLGFFVSAMLISLSASLASADTLTLYDADPDNNAGTAAPDPTSMGWNISNLDGQTTNAGFSTAGLTTGGAGAWILNDSGPTGTGPNQNNALGFLLNPTLIDQMHSGGFVLTMQFEQLNASGAFVGMAFNHGATGVPGDRFGLTANSRYGQTPTTAGLQTFTYTWDGTTFTPNAGAGGPGGFSNFWGGATEGGGQVFFGDNTRTSSVFNLGITKVTLSGANITAVPEPASATILGLGLGALALVRRKR